MMRMESLNPRITGVQRGEASIHEMFQMGPANEYSGSAWKYDEASQEYYLHLYAPEQPDLNWENPKLRAAVHDIVRFWLDKGVDGFRYAAFH